MPPVPSSPRVKLRATSRRVPRARSAGTTTADAAEYEPEPNMKLSRALAAMLLLHVVAVGGIFAFSLIKDHNPAHPTVAGGTADTQNATEAEDAHLPGATTTRDTGDMAGRPTVHVVRPGETLTRIANANGVSLEALVAANGAGSFNSGIHPGQQLKLPEKVVSPTTRASNPGNDALNLIEQKSGDANDADIAAATGTTNTSPTGSSKPAVRLPPDSGQTYTVGKGESPYTIAHKLKVNADTLLKLNGIDDPKKIKPGQKLRVPAKPPEMKTKLKA